MLDGDLTNITHYFEQQGSGPPIVFIHGSYATTSTWRKMVEQLTDHYLCILIKLPGHCGTPDPCDFNNPSFETETAIIESIVKTLTSEPIHLVGHSVGANIALVQALKGSLNLHKLTLFEPVSIWVLRLVNHESMVKIVDDFLAKYRVDALNNTPQVCGQVIDFWAGEAAFDSLPEFIQQSMAPLVKNNLRHWDCDLAITYTLPDIYRCSVPTNLVCGNHSNPVANAICTHLNEHLPNSTKTTIEGASHFLVTSHVKECLKAMGQNPNMV